MESNVHSSKIFLIPLKTESMSRWNVRAVFLNSYGFLKYSYKPNDVMIAVLLMESSLMGIWIVRSVQVHFTQKCHPS
uniref:Uncharacterized protein n=1 Tax=Lepeophtheirus salmonis TaxID=72036 RepID=A0A0K2TP71_LEPSM